MYTRRCTSGVRAKFPAAVGALDIETARSHLGGGRPGRGSEPRGAPPSYQIRAVMSARGAPPTARVADAHMDAAIRWEDRIPARGYCPIAGKDIHLTADHANAPIFRDETAVVRHAPFTRQPSKLGDEKGRAERDDRRVDGDGAE